MNIKKLKEDLLHRLESFKDVLHQIKRVLLKIWKIIQYIPILWKDEDWDYEYLLILIKYKIGRIAKCIRSENIIVEKEIEQIESSIEETLQHIDNYLNADNVYKEKFGALPFEIGFSSIPSTGHEGFFQMISINKCTGEILSEKEEEEYANYLKSSNKFEQDEWNAIFDTIKKHGQSWWD